MWIVASEPVHYRMHCVSSNGERENELSELRLQCWMLDRNRVHNSRRITAIHLRFNSFSDDFFFFIGDFTLQIFLRIL